jgi:hypothetical protein
METYRVAAEICRECKEIFLLVAVICRVEAVSDLVEEEICHEGAKVLCHEYAAVIVHVEEVSGHVSKSVRLGRICSLLVGCYCTQVKSEGTVAR